jgi:hypothetical protein
VFGFLKKKKVVSEEPKRKFPPTPDWRPSIEQPIDQIAERLRHYTNGIRDFALFTHGTIAILPSGLTETQAEIHAKEALAKVFHAHPDMHPLQMNDGNILVRYNHDVVNIVLDEVSAQHWVEIKSEHQGALARDEVLITPLGQNKFDDFGMKALFGRCFMFMDAEAPAVLRFERQRA